MDDVAREYLLLGLSLGELEDGLVDAYYGPPEIRQAAGMQRASPAELAQRAADLRTQLPSLDDAQRALWFDRQLVALETLARRLAGEQFSYVDEVTRCFDARPEPTPPEEYAQVRQVLDELLPGQGDLRPRLEAHDARLTVPGERLGQIVDWLVAELRGSCSRIFPLPEGEALSVSLVTDQPWSAYNWYDGGLRSRIKINTDLPVRAPMLIGLLAHEAFPGHHLEHAWKETRLARQADRTEAALQLINTPEAYISEGLAEVGSGFVAGEPEWQRLLVEICARADIPMTSADAEREWHIAQALRRLRGSSGDAALLLHVGGRAREDVVAFLEQDALRTRAQAEKSLDFISHPLWRTYVFCYAGGERLLGQWCAAGGDPTAQRARFLRLLTEQLTPSGIAAEMV